VHDPTLRCRRAPRDATARPVVVPGDAACGTSRRTLLRLSRRRRSSQTSPLFAQIFGLRILGGMAFSQAVAAIELAYSCIRLPNEEGTETWVRSTGSGPLGQVASACPTKRALKPFLACAKAALAEYRCIRLPNEEGTETQEPLAGGFDDVAGCIRLPNEEGTETRKERVAHTMICVASACPTKRALKPGVARQPSVGCFVASACPTKRALKPILMLLSSLFMRVASACPTKRALKLVFVRFGVAVGHGVASACPTKRALKRGIPVFLGRFPRMLHPPAQRRGH
jgi:hypothetical protein